MDWVMERNMYRLTQKEKRSRLMARIGDRNTRPESKAGALLLEMGFAVYPHPRIYGRPDFLLPQVNTVVFVNGCFWHGCERHFRMPKTNVPFWRLKIFKNVRRQGRVTKALEGLGYNVFVVWEHSIKPFYGKTGEELDFLT